MVRLEDLLLLNAFWSDEELLPWLEGCGEELPLLFGLRWSVTPLALCEAYLLLLLPMLPEACAWCCWLDDPYDSLPGREAECDVPMAMICFFLYLKDVDVSGEIINKR